MMGTVDDSARRMIGAVTAAERRSPREVLARQFRALTTPQEPNASRRPSPVEVSRWFEEAELRRQQQRAAARKAAAKKRAMTRKARTKQATTPSCPHPKKRDECEGVLITSASLLR
jgi:hypothetical protein